METIGVYVHIPFCLKKCGYCDFLSFPYDEEEMAAYVEALVEEIMLYEKGRYTIESLFFGGGTPSLLKIEELARIMAALKERFSFEDHAEITLESNPGTWTLTNAKGYKALGINRISMGVQSLNEDMLKVLGRQHDVADVHASIGLLRTAGFTNINMDLMFALPGQSLKALDKTLEGLLALEPSHISAYSLTYEPGTPFYDREEDKADDGLDREMYSLVKERLKARGYLQYELSNFARPGYACKHNLVYWKRKPYIGLGLNAHGCLEDVRLANTDNMTTYKAKLALGQWPRVSRSVLDKADQEFEHIMLGLRLNEGLNIKKFNEIFETDFEKKYSHVLKELSDDGLLVKGGGVISLTDKGMDLSNHVYIKFL